MREKILTIEYLGNCSVLMRYPGNGVLVDGLFSEKQEYDPPIPWMDEQIIGRDGIFRTLNYLVVSHCHGDHYDKAKVKEALSRGVTAVLPPDAKVKGGHQLPLSEEDGIHRLQLGEMELEYCRMKHIEGTCPDNYCINILAGDTSVLLTGDMDPAEIPRLSEFSRRDRSVGFVNGIALWSRVYRKQLRDLGYENLFFYHLPGEGRGPEGYRRRTLRFWEKCQQELPHGKLLDGPEVIYEVY